MGLVVYNTLTRRKDAFEPLDPANVGMYVCGPTVYDYAHVGNARPIVVFDTLYRLLRQLYGVGHVTYVRNITDVEDKINEAARAAGESIEAITTRTTKAFHEDIAALNALPPDQEPRATGHIPEMIEMISNLIEKEHAYVADGHVLFHVPSMPDYGRFANIDRDEQVAGARVEVAPYKKDAADFVLWKPSDADTPGWDSPWGRGRPGWHIECSAMSKKYLGQTFDIHGGGVDLVFPHHQNEVAQSACAHDGAPLARYWMHNGYVVVEGEKMSKSLGNFFTVRDMLGEFPGEAIRLALLTAHYRQPLDFTRDGVARARRTLDHWYRRVGDTPKAEAPPAAVVEALSDDLNTPQAIAAMHDLNDPAELRAAADLLGLLEQDAEAWFKAGVGVDGPSDREIEAAIQNRTDARKNRDFAAADKIRDDLLAQGIVLEDGAGGTTWRRGA